MRSRIHTPVVVLGLLLAAAREACPAEVAPEVLDFGPVRTGSILVDTVRVRNTSANELLVTALGLEGGVFDLASESFSGAPVVVAPGAEVPALVRFGPVDTVRYEGRIRFAFEGGEVSAVLRGEGVAEAVVIDEVLADPPTGDDGDANGDGVRSSSQDEFVELLNISRVRMDLGGFQVSDEGTAPGSRFTFPPGTAIGPGERIVLFGGGVPTGIPGQVFVDDGTFGRGLSNTGDAAYLIDPSGPDTLARVVYGSEANNDQSLVRTRNGRGPFVRHTTPPGRGKFSPGTGRSSAVSLDVHPDELQLAVGGEAQLSVRGVYGPGDSLLIDAGLLLFRSDDEEVAQVAGDGTVRALASGSAVISVSVDGDLSAQAVVAVERPHLAALAIEPADTTVVSGDSVRFTAVGADGTGPVGGDGTGPFAVPDAVWSSADPDVAEVDATGLAQAIRPGTTRVTAASDGREADATLRAVARGDLNANGQFDLGDAVRIAHLIIEEPPPPTPLETRAGDVDVDGRVDVRDLAAAVFLLLGTPPGNAKPVPSPVAWRIEGRTLEIVRPAAVASLSFLLQGAWTTAGPALCRTYGGRTLLAFAPPAEAADTLRFQLESAGPDAPIVLGAAAVDRSGRPAALVASLHHPALRAFPNPFNGTTVLSFRVEEGGPVRLAIYSAAGQELDVLVDEVRAAGAYASRWSGRDARGRAVSSGIYLAALRHGHGSHEVVKLALVE